MLKTMSLLAGRITRRSVGHSRGTITSRYIHTVDTALIMAADSIAGYIQGLLDGVAFTHTAYALDRDSRKSALAHFLGADGQGHRGYREGDIGRKPGTGRRWQSPDIGVKYGCKPGSAMPQLDRLQTASQRSRLTGCEQEASFDHLQIMA